MTNAPQPFWAIILAVLGVIVTIVVYLYPGDVTTRQAAFQIGSALVTGALGAFAGHATAAQQKSNPTQNSTEETK
jgi:uncharacterized membrane protein